MYTQSKAMKIGGVASSGGALCRSHSRREISVRSNTTTSPSKIAVGERRVEQADEVVAVVTTMVVAVSAVPSATAVSGPGSQDHDAKRLKSGR